MMMDFISVVPIFHVLIQLNLVSTYIKRERLQRVPWAGERPEIS